MPSYDNTKNGTIDFVFKLSGLKNFSINHADLMRTNHLIGSGDNTKELTDGTYYIFAKSGDDAVFAPLATESGTTLARNKAALQMPSPTSAAVLYTEGEMLTGSKIVNVSQTGVGAGSSLSGAKSWNSDQWTNGNDDEE